jgi:hypothetical protein
MRNQLPRELPGGTYCLAEVRPAPRRVIAADDAAGHPVAASLAVLTFGPPQAVSVKPR